MGVLSLGDVAFAKGLDVGFVIIKIIGFAFVIIIGFDLHVAKVGDLAIGIMYYRFFMKATIWIKTSEKVDGRKWTIIQTKKIKFFYIVSWPFGNH
jgi:hypothetical protein